MSHFYWVLSKSWYHNKAKTQIMLPCLFFLTNYEISLGDKQASYRSGKEENEVPIIPIIDSNSADENLDLFS